MKKTIYLFAISLGILAVSCAEKKEKTTNELLGDTKSKVELFDAIINDTTHLSSFMKKVMEKEKAKEAFICNHDVLRVICMSGEMRNLMKADQEVMETVTSNLMMAIGDDTSACTKTCEKMMKNEFMKKFMKNKSCKDCK